VYVSSLTPKIAHSSNCIWFSLIAFNIEYCFIFQVEATKHVYGIIIRFHVSTQCLRFCQIKLFCKCWNNQTNPCLWTNAVTFTLHYKCIRMCKVTNMIYMIQCSVSADDKVDMPDTLGHAVGTERFELLAKAAGNEASTVQTSQSMFNFIFISISYIFLIHQGLFVTKLLCIS